MDGRRRACIDCGIVTRRKAVSARLVVPGDRSLRKLTRWVAVWALCPGGHLMRPRTLQQFASICATSQLVQYPAKWCNTTYGQALAWARSAYRTREGATLHQLGMQCTTEHGNAPAIRQCIASTRGALPLISGVTCPQMRTRTHLATMRDHSQPIKWRHPAGLCTRCVALHPLRGAAPVAWHYTPCVALHQLRGAAPDQNGCNAHGLGAMPTDRVCRAHRQERVRNLEPRNVKEGVLSAPTRDPGLGKPIKR